MAAEYILAHGNPHVVLCERGIRAFDPAFRFTLDLNAVPMVKELTHLPVIVDPSHGTGKRSLVSAMALAGIAAGADGLIIETHPDPDSALCDAAQTITPAELGTIARQRRRHRLHPRGANCSGDGLRTSHRLALVIESHPGRTSAIYGDFRPGSDPT